MKEIGTAKPMCEYAVQVWVRRCRMRREPGEATGLLAPRPQEAAKCNVVSGLRAAGRRRKNRERAGRGGSNASGSWLCLLPLQACPPLAKATIVRPGGGFPMQPPSVASGFRNRDDEARSSSPSYYLNPIISLPPSSLHPSLLSPNHPYLSLSPPRPLHPTIPPGPLFVSEQLSHSTSVGSRVLSHCLHL